MDNKDKYQATPPETEKPKTLGRKVFQGTRRVFSKAKELGKELVPQDEKIPVKDINIHSVAKTIVDNVTHPYYERVGREIGDISFDITKVITNMGYIAPSAYADYQTKFPEAYQVTRRSLWDLRQLEALDMEIREDSNTHKENTFYRVRDLNRLTDIANNPPQKPSE